jgi:hypothetical protein
MHYVFFDILDGILHGQLCPNQHSIGRKGVTLSRKVDRLIFSKNKTSQKFDLSNIFWFVIFTVLFVIREIAKTSSYSIESY